MVVEVVTAVKCPDELIPCPNCPCCPNWPPCCPICPACPKPPPPCPSCVPCPNCPPWVATRLATEVTATPLVSENRFVKDGEEETAAERGGVVETELEGGCPVAIMFPVPVVS